MWFFLHCSQGISLLVYLATADSWPAAELSAWCVSAKNHASPRSSDQEMKDMDFVTAQNLF